MTAPPTPVDQGPGGEGGQFLRSLLLNSVLVLAFVVGVIPIVAIVHGFIDLVISSLIRSGADWVAYGFAFTGLLFGATFFAYAIKYYLSTAMVLLTTLVGVGPRKANGNGQHQDVDAMEDVSVGGAGYHPFVSVHVATYTEKRVIDRLLTALEQLGLAA